MSQGDLSDRYAPPLPGPPQRHFEFMPGGAAHKLRPRLISSRAKAKRTGRPSAEALVSPDLGKMAPWTDHASTPRRAIRFVGFCPVPGCTPRQRQRAKKKTDDVSLNVSRGGSWMVNVKRNMQAASGRCPFWLAGIVIVKVCVLCCWVLGRLARNTRRYPVLVRACGANSLTGIDGLPAATMRSDPAVWPAAVGPHFACLGLHLG